MTNAGADSRQSSGPHNPSLFIALDECVDLYALHRLARDRYPFLLQSTAANSELGQYDILFAAPGESLILETPDSLPLGSSEKSFLQALDRWWATERVAESSFPLPFSGGWFLYLGYELAQQIEPALQLTADPVLPTAFAVRCPAAIVRDNMSGRCWFVRECEADIDDAQIYADIEECNRAAPEHEHTESVATLVNEEEPADFIDAVAQAKDYITAGDIYQANLSRAWTATTDSHSDADCIYRSLGRSNPGPFAGIVRWQDTTIMSSSPERLLSVRAGIASTRPIAGTRPRSTDLSTDDNLSTELFAHPKERAEHIMLVDLERNDLGRICMAGTVDVSEMMVLESYAHVHHIVSNVRGRIRPDVAPGTAIAAVFPGGTITGCPKVRCMQVIDELEGGPRGAYTGSFGYLNRDGSLDLNILIRTIVMNGRDISFRAGSGIVADSQPEQELAETRAKAKGLLKAISG